MKFQNRSEFLTQKSIKYNEKSKNIRKIIKIDKIQNKPVEKARYDTKPDVVPDNGQINTTKVVNYSL